MIHEDLFVIAMYFSYEFFSSVRQCTTIWGFCQGDSSGEVVLCEWAWSRWRLQVAQDSKGSEGSKVSRMCLYTLVAHSK